MCVHISVIWCHLSVKVYTRRLRKNTHYIFIFEEGKKVVMVTPLQADQLFIK